MAVIKTVRWKTPDNDASDSFIRKKVGCDNTNCPAVSTRAYKMFSLIVCKFTVVVCGLRKFC